MIRTHDNRSARRRSCSALAGGAGRSPTQSSVRARHGTQPWRLSRSAPWFYCNAILSRSIGVFLCRHLIAQNRADLGGIDPAGLDYAEYPTRLVQHLIDLKKQLDLEQTLAMHGVKLPNLPMLSVACHARTPDLKPILVSPVLKDVG